MTCINSFANAKRPLAAQQLLLHECQMAHWAN